MEWFTKDNGKRHLDDDVISVTTTTISFSEVIVGSNEFVKLVFCNDDDVIVGFKFGKEGYNIQRFVHTRNIFKPTRFQIPVGRYKLRRDVQEDGDVYYICKSMKVNE